MKLSWLDIRSLTETKAAIVQEALHARLDGIVADDPADLRALPPTVKKVLFPHGKSLPEDIEGIDVVIVDPAEHGDPGQLALRYPGVEFGRFVEITDALTLEDACQSARTELWSLLLFRDPTKIPLEIVIAAAARATGNLMTIAADAQEAEIIFGVLEHGSDGVLMAPAGVGDAFALKASATPGTPEHLMRSR